MASGSANISLSSVYKAMHTIPFILFSCNGTSQHCLQWRIPSSIFLQPFCCITIPGHNYTHSKWHSFFPMPFILRRHSMYISSSSSPYRKATLTLTTLAAYPKWVIRSNKPHNIMKFTTGKQCCSSQVREIGYTHITRQSNTCHCAWFGTPLAFYALAI